MLEEGEAPGAIVERLGLLQIVDDDALSRLVETVLAAHPEKAQLYREGKKGLLGFLLGQAMKKSKGAADPQALRASLEAALK